MPIYGSSTLVEYLHPHPTEAEALLLRLELDARYKRGLGETADFEMAVAQLEYICCPPGVKRKACRVKIAQLRERCVELQAAADESWRVYDVVCQVMGRNKRARPGPRSKKRSDAHIAAVLSHKDPAVREAAMLALR